MQFPSRPPDKLSPRPDFRPEEFRKLVFHRGMNMVWEQSQECPCRRTATDFSGARFSSGLFTAQSGTTTEARPDCEMCKGEGYFLHSAQEIKALLTRASATPEAYTAYGEFTRGTVFLTLLPEHLPAMFDRVTLADSVMVYRESRIRTANAIESLRYPIETRGLDLQSGATQVNVLHVQSSQADGLSTSTDTMIQGVNFAVTGGKIDWSLGDAGAGSPGEGNGWTVTYYARPRYVILDHPHTHRDTFIKVKAPDITFAPLPVQCMARLDFLGDAPQ